MPSIYEEQGKQVLTLAGLSLLIGVTLLNRMREKSSRNKKPNLSPDVKLESSRLRLLTQSEDHSVNVMRISRELKDVQYITPIHLDITTIQRRKLDDQIKEEQRFMQEALDQIKIQYPNKPKVPVVIYVNRLYIVIVD